MKILPKFTPTPTTTPPKGFATQFACDVMERAGQKIVVLRENVTQYTWTKIIPDQQAQTLSTFLLEHILPLVGEQECVIRTDGAPCFKSLAKAMSVQGSIWSMNKLTIDIGRVTNPNHNPQAANAVKNVEKEILRLSPTGGPVTPVLLTQATVNLNSRVSGKLPAPRERLYARAVFTNSPVKVDDESWATQLYLARSKSHIPTPNTTHHIPPTHSFKPGQLVFVVNQLDKNKARELYTVMDIVKEDDTEFVVIKKSENQFRQASIKVRPCEIVLATEPPVISDNSPKPQRRAAQLARQRLKLQCVSCPNSNPKSKYPWNISDNTDLNHQTLLTHSHTQRHSPVKLDLTSSSSDSVSSEDFSTPIKSNSPVRPAIIVKHPNHFTLKHPLPLVGGSAPVQDLTKHLQHLDLAPETPPRRSTRRVPRVEDYKALHTRGTSQH